MSLLPILTVAWRTTLRERRLWPYALFAGLGIGSGLGSAIFQLSGSDPSITFFAALREPTQAFGALGAIWTTAQANNWNGIAGILTYEILIIAVVAAIAWLTILGANALVIAASHTARAEQIPTNIRQRAQQQFWPAAAVQVSAKILAILIITAVDVTYTWAAFTATATPAIVATTAFVVAGLMLAVIHITTAYAIAAIVLGRRPPTAAFRDATNLIRKHYRVTAITTVILSGVNVVGLIVALLGGFLLSLPFLFLGGIGVTRGIISLITASTIVGIIIIAAWLAVVAATLTTFIATTWTLLYLRLTQPEEEPKM
ncbi:MAG: hypothetical protein V1723_00625 [Candidatus Uhrbacteria bacterium]